MRRMRAVCAVAICVLSTASFGAITAEAATQAGSQSINTNQTQQVDTQSGGNVSQCETSTLTSQQTETTQKQTPDQNVNNTDQSYSDAQQDHSVTGHGKYSQAQTSTAHLAMNKTVTDSHSAITASANADSTQHGSIVSDGKSTIKQSSSSLISGFQSQTAQEQSVSGSYVQYTHQSSVTQSADIAGYAVFDTDGHLLSDGYGNVSNVDNNARKQFDAFAPYDPKPVVVAAVNAQGEIVPNSGDTTLYLLSNNANSTFLYPATMQDIHSVQLPAGSEGVTIGYVNSGHTAAYDVLDVSLTDPNAVVHHPNRQVTQVATQPTVETTTQNQTGSVGGATAKQSQTTAADSTGSESAGAPTAQTSTLKQTSDASQNQTVAMSNGSNLQQNEESKVSAQQNTPTPDGSQPAATVDVTQQESAAGSDIHLSQNQCVTVLGPSINVVFTQAGTIDKDKSSVTLDESIGVQVSSAANNEGNTVVHVTYQGAQKDYVLDTSGSVTLSESQDASNSEINHKVSIDYKVGETPHNIIVAD